MKTASNHFTSLVRSAQRRLDLLIMKEITTESVELVHGETLIKSKGTVLAAAVHAPFLHEIFVLALLL